MIVFFYDLLLLIASLFMLPLMLWQRFRRGKYKQSLLSRLGLSDVEFVKEKGDKLVWIHAVSVGEVKAACSFCKKIKQLYPSVKVVLSTITETGQAEARRSVANIDHYFYLPLDLSFVMKRYCRAIKPDLLVLVEGDLWYNLLRYAKKCGANTLLVSGKMSERSMGRFLKVPLFCRGVIESLDFFCVQSQEMKDRFIRLGAPPSKVAATGNIKLDADLKVLSKQEREELIAKLSITSSDRVVTLASTHESEEKLLLSQLRLDGKLKLLLVPRHPERFDEVTLLLKKMGLSFSRFSEDRACTKTSQIVLIDCMGVLNSLYQVSSLSIVAGSFTGKVGGHNIFESILHGTPVIFGPFMYAQKNLKELCLDYQAGVCSDIGDIAANVTRFFCDSSFQHKLKTGCARAIAVSKGSIECTIAQAKSVIKSALEKK